jgi:alpha-glucosidase
MLALHSLGLFGLYAVSSVIAQSECSGYTATNIQQTNNGLTADLHLAGRACDVYGVDLPNLTLTVEYQTGTVKHRIWRCQH